MRHVVGLAAFTAMHSLLGPAILRLVGGSETVAGGAAAGRRRAVGVGRADQGVSGPAPPTSEEQVREGGVFLPAKQRYVLRRLAEAWEFGAGLDYKL
jgi:hypothetical protein